jgi:hypothetical protein
VLSVILPYARAITAEANWICDLITVHDLKSFTHISTASPSRLPHKN